jgi:hypothetical protein
VVLGLNLMFHQTGREGRRRRGGDSLGADPKAEGLRYEPPL